MIKNVLIMNDETVSIEFENGAYIYLRKDTADLLLKYLKELL